MRGARIHVPREDYWRDPKVLAKHAKRRREKYSSDPEVRQAEKQRQRKLYRAKQGEKFTNPARDALAKGLTDEEYTGAEIATLLGRAPEYVNRLINRGLWPNPRSAPTQQPCFTKADTERMLAVFADHVDNVASTYRADHEETTKALFAAMQDGCPRAKGGPR